MWYHKIIQSNWMNSPGQLKSVVISMWDVNYHGFYSFFQQFESHDLTCCMRCKVFRNSNCYVFYLICCVYYYTSPFLCDNLVDGINNILYSFIWMVLSILEILYILLYIISGILYIVTNNYISPNSIGWIQIEFLLSSFMLIYFGSQILGIHYFEINILSG